MRDSALRPTCAPKREHQEQKDLKLMWICSGLERSDKKKEQPTHLAVRPGRSEPVLRRWEPAAAL
jgi:hypothetical protein